MKAVGRTAIVMTALLSLLLAAGCRDEHDRLAERYAAQAARRHAEAVQRHTRAIEGGELSQGDLAEAYYRRGLAHEEARYFDLAIADFTKVVELAPEYTDVYFHRGICHQFSGDYDNAIADMTKSIERKPGDTWAYGIRMHAYRAKGDRTKAEADARKIQELSEKMWEDAGAQADEKDGTGDVWSKKTHTLALADGVTMKLVRIEAGKFTMGSPRTETHREKREGPRRQVTITKPFYMGATEVTQAQWRAVMNTQPWKGRQGAKARADHAASHISWNDAMAFCAALSKKTGPAVRLPTEAEWEYACRAGTATAYSFGDDPSKLADYAWYGGNALSTGEEYAHAVGAKKPNAWDLHDMHGNLFEWCADWYADSYADADTRDPKGPATGKRRVLRGGSWSNFPDYCRAAFRRELVPDIRDHFNGFRVVVEVK